jgi:hypothetical protein
MTDPGHHIGRIRWVSRSMTMVPADGYLKIVECWAP